MNTTILLADDHAILRDGLKNIIGSQCDLKVVGEAGTGRDAVAMAAQLCPDVVIMDICMPDLNGVEATRRIRTADSQVRVVALSAYCERQFVAAMLEAGASAYVLKSAAAEELILAIRTVLGGRRYVSPAAAALLVTKAAGSAPAREVSVHAILTSREREVLQLVAEGKNSRQIASELGIAQYTVNVHRRNIMQKLDLRNVAQLTRCAIREGLTPA